MDILNVHQKILDDKSIIGYNYHHYKPYSPNEIGRSDEIRIPIQCSDLFLHLAEGYIYVSGVLNTHTETGVKTVKNYPFYLFEECRLEISGHCIDSVKDLGVVANIKNLLLKSVCESKSSTSLGWFPSDNILKNNAKFDFCLPLKEIFGFCADYTKIVAFVTPEIVLKRSRTDANCFFSETNAETVAITLKNVYLSVPHVELAPVPRLKFLKILENGRPLEMNFRSHKLFVHPKVPKTTQFFWQVQSLALSNRPIFVILAFSDGRADNLKKDFTHFDSTKIRNLKLHLNSQSIPYEQQLFDFAENKISEAYKSFSDFRKFYLGRDTDETALSVDNFVKNYPLFVFNCMFVEPVLKAGSIDVRLECEFHENITSENCTAFCLIVTEQSILYNPLTHIVESN